MHRNGSTQAFLRTSLAVCALTLALSGCGDDGEEATTTEALDLTGRSFTATEVRGHDLVEGTSVVLTFETDRVGATAGCNSLGGPASWDDGTLSVSADELAQTLIGCPPDLQAQDGWLTELLTSSPALALDGSTLTVGDEEAGMTLDEQSDLPLTGTAWSLQGLVDGDAVSSVDPALRAGIQVDAAGTVLSVSTGCNSGSGDVTVPSGGSSSEGTMIVGPLRTTLVACPPDVAQVEAAVLAVLAGEVTYQVEGATLRLTNGARGLTFTG